jgi:hypothetical protein
MQRHLRIYRREKDASITRELQFCNPTRVPACALFSDRLCRYSMEVRKEQVQVNGLRKESGALDKVTPHPAAQQAMVIRNRYAQVSIKSRFQ